MELSICKKYRKLNNWGNQNLYLFQIFQIHIIEVERTWIIFEIIFYIKKSQTNVWIKGKQ